MDNLLTFYDVWVGPTQEILKAPAASLFRGGPLWPDYDDQTLARQCRGIEIKVVDDKPSFDTSGDLRVDEGIWCGPTVHHFGHMIADFSMRVILSAQLSPGLPLVFSGAAADKKGKIQDAPSYFWAMIDHFRIDRKRVVIVREPTLFRTLHVFPQAERMHGPAPVSSYLDLLDKTTGLAANSRVADVDKLYVSRSKFIAGGLAGEAYLDKALEKCGVKVIYPEELPLAEQMKYYQSAKTLVFSEGSAVHALQLIGRLNADVGILVRRAKARIAHNSVQARANSTQYLEASPELVYGLRASGLGNQSKGITLLSGAGIIEKFQAMGIDIAKKWNEKEFKTQQLADLKAWMTLRLENPKAHPDEKNAIERSLQNLSRPVSIDELNS